jgi:regulatory protein
MADDSIKARKKAMDLLARREHARVELERKLVAAGFDTDVAAAALQALKDEGLQSDRRFVESFVQSRINQGKGPLRIHADLGQRGVAPGVVDAVLEHLDEDWYARARDARMKKFGRSPPSGFRDKARQMRFLQYRGFEPDQIQAAFAAFDE